MTFGPRFNREQLFEFVIVLDKHLTKKSRGLLVGGAAAALAYKSTIRTNDLDFSALENEVEVSQAGTKARAETGYAIAVGITTVAELPRNFEDRVQEMTSPKLANLTIIVPDKYDLALSKAVRGYPHDDAAIKEIHEHNELDLKTLIDRFETEFVKEATADERKFRINMVQVVEKVFGREDGAKLATKWSLW